MPGFLFWEQQANFLRTDGRGPFYALINYRIVESLVFLEEGEE
jgi:hypothetical protein